MIAVEHLDLNVARHCNLRCVSCSHYSPIASRWLMPLDMIERDLLALRPILKPRSVNVVGGEPLLHPEIAEILKLLKRIRIDEKTVVITNGTLLPRMRDDFWRELECLKISIYATLKPEILELAEAKCAEFGFELTSESFPEFFVQIKSVPDDGEESFKKCKWKSDCYTVHDGYFYLCPQSAFYPHVGHGDALILTGITERLLREFMDSPEPLHACSTCAAADLIPRAWSEERNADEWRRKSTV